MAKARHRAPLARRVELVRIVSGPAPLRLPPPQNRRERRMLSRAQQRAANKKRRE